MDYPEDEVQVHAELNRYAELRRRTSKGAASKGTADLVTLLLKKRLFSSPAAFAATLDVHRETLAQAPRSAVRPDARRFFDRLDEDFDDEDEAQAVEEEALAVAAASLGDLGHEEEELFRRMAAWASANRGRPDAKALRLLDWVEETCRADGPEGIRTWNTERVILFTEYRTTQLYLQQLLEARGLGGERLALLYGGMDEDARERIKDEFQHPPGSARCGSFWRPTPRARASTSSATATGSSTSRSPSRPRASTSATAGSTDTASPPLRSSSTTSSARAGSTPPPSGGAGSPAAPSRPTSRSCR